jgi:hypothetical protein
VESARWIRRGDLAWEKCDDWKDIVERLAESADGTELLSAPIGPLLLEEVSESSIKDIYKIDAVKRDKEDAKEELKAARDLLKGLWNRKAPDDPDEPDEPEGQPETTTGSKSPSERTLGKFLETLGLLTSKGKIAELSKLTVWDVFSRTLDEMDGFPLYVLGVNPSDDKGVRAALTLASQSDLSNLPNIILDSPASPTTFQSRRPPRKINIASPRSICSLKRMMTIPPTRWTIAR